jgi:hypothetical protein
VVEAGWKMAGAQAGQEGGGFGVDGQREDQRSGWIVSEDGGGHLWIEIEVQDYIAIVGNAGVLRAYLYVAAWCRQLQMTSRSLDPDRSRTVINLLDGSSCPADLYRISTQAKTGEAIDRLEFLVHSITQFEQCRLIRRLPRYPTPSRWKGSKEMRELVIHPL